MVKQITSPGWVHETSAWAWCTAKTQRDPVEREAGGGIGMGNTCKSMADAVVFKIALFAFLLYGTQGSQKCLRASAVW